MHTTYYDRILNNLPKSDDDSLVKRGQCVDWHKRGRAPKDDGTMWHRKAHRRVVELLKDYTCKELADHIGTYPSLIYRLNKQEYRHVPEQKARAIAQGDYSKLAAKHEDMERKWELYRKAQKKLREEYMYLIRPTRLQDIARKYGLGKSQVAKCIRDYYKTPHDQIIEKVIED